MNEYQVSLHISDATNATYLLETVKYFTEYQNITTIFIFMKCKTHIENSKKLSNWGGQ
ncbi:MAG: hypothetical protein HXS44_14810 [Theionarchaea archaeon]|nr:hypothetical protein [Theionarchaea archaeon]